MSKSVILSSARTPIGRLGGGLASVDATELGGIAVEAALERAEVAPERLPRLVETGLRTVPPNRIAINATRYQ